MSLTWQWHNLATAGVVVQGGYPGPAELLAALREAEAAHTRCRRLLLTASVAYLDGMGIQAAHMEAPLQLMVELQGDSLRAPPGPSRVTVFLRVMAALAHNSAARRGVGQAGDSGDQQITCSGCKQRTSTLRKCAACNQAQYCRCAQAADRDGRDALVCLCL